MSHVPAALLGLASLAAPAAAQIVFEPPLVSTSGSHANRVLVGDLDEDGVPDALVSHFPIFGGPAVWLPGQGDGGFGPPQPLPLGEFTTPTDLADFDADGHLDLVAFGGDGPPQNVSLRFGDGTGGFGPALAMNAMFFQGPADAQAGDFDGDGALDLAIYNMVGSFTQPGGIVVRYGHGDGTFEPPVLAKPFGSDMQGFPLPQWLGVGDTNGDGLDDIVYAGLSPVLLSVGRSFVSPACPPLSGNGLAIADLDGDGRDDALTPALARLAQPDGSLGPALPLPSGTVAWRVAAGDLDGDGLVDAIVGRKPNEAPFEFESTEGDVILLRGLGDGTFEAPGVVVSHVPQPFGVAAADLDLDGRLDVLASQLISSPDALAVLLNHTYGPGSPFLDLGGALAGTNGHPIQLASGTLVAGQPFAFKLFHGPPSGAAFHIVGLAALGAPFKGGTLIPFPHLVNGPLPLNAQGAINLAALWPAGGSGLTLWVQFWMPNGGGPVGFVASSGVRAQIP